MDEIVLDPAALIPDDEVFVRMSAAERWQHGLLAASFIVLVVTGLPLMAGESGVIRLIAGRPGGHALRGILHRAAAVVLVADLVWKIGYAIFSERGRRNFRDKTLRWKDIEDLIATVGHNAGLSGFLARRGLFRRFFERHPYWLFAEKREFGRYSFIEKFEYWSVLWGSAVMILTGFFMWGPGLSLRLFPLWLHQVFVVVHGYEAVLALLSVAIWHMYTAHLDPGVFPMSRVWLDGGITGADLRRLHPLEYRRILKERERLYREFIALEPNDGPPGPA
jgi:cytochrome b subunit of formate dehydrogenase